MYLAGDTVLVRDGTYVENITFPANKNLVLKSENGPLVTTIDGSGTANQAVIKMPNTNQTTATVIMGFTITGGTGAPSYYDGGGIYMYNASATLVNNVVIGNHAGRDGGGICCTRGTGTSTLILRNNLIVNNTATGTGADGGGIYLKNTQSTITGCIIAGNSASEKGDGILLVGPKLNPGLDLQNSIVYGNGPSVDDYEIWVDNNKLAIDYADVEDGTQDIRLENGAELVWGTNNLTTDPLFVDPGSGDYHLQIDSPCINAGDPAYTPGAGETDIDGEERVMNGRVDMGADEVEVSQPDTDGDGVPDAEDNCPTVPNPGQEDGDTDGVGNVCDNCPTVYNPDQANADGDSAGDACDGCPDDANKIVPGQCGCGVADTDTDGDGLADCVDPCPARKPGDVSGDGLVDSDDVSPFVVVLLDPAGATPDDRCAADVDGSGTPDGADIQGFVNALLPVP